MKSFFKILICILFFSSLAIAQKSVTIFNRPFEYDRPTGQLLPSHLVKKGSGLFTAMSDRDENPLYESASKSSNKLSSLKFLDPFYIIGEEGDFFKVAEYDDTNKPTGNVLKNPKNVGYVDKSNLILWKTAIQNDKGFVKKALSIVKGDVLMNKGKFISDKGEIKCYSNPDLNSKYLMKESGLNIFRFLYVVKENPDAKMVLLAYQPQFSISIKDRIIGWVPQNIVQIWENRLCLEPNFSQEAIDERRLNGVYSSLFISENAALDFKKSYKESISDSIIIESASREAWKRFKKRLPILSENKEDKIFETGYTTPIVNPGSGVEEISEGQWDDLASDATKRKILLRNINVVFVIDGSAALSNYMSSITNAISQIKRDFSDDVKRLNRIKYGVVVYRNNEDVNCPNVGDVSTSKSPLSKNPEDILQFIERESKITGCNDNIYSKALYKGLLEGLNMFNTKVGVLESNYMILIGGAGENIEDDDKNAPVLQKIIDLYVKTGVNMFAYQYRRLGKVEYRGFTAQVQNILQKGNEGILNDSKDVNKKGEKILPINWERIEEEGLNSYKAIENDNFVKFAEFTWPQTESNIPEQFFLRQMDSFISRATTQSNENIKKIDHVFLLGQKADITNAVRVLLKGINVSGNYNQDEIVKAFNGDNYQFFGRCYAPIKVNGLKHDLFRRVFFFTEDELSNLIQKLVTLEVSDDDIALNRTELYSALVELAKGYVGSAEAKNMDLNKLLTYIVGMDQHSNVFNSIDKLEDIKDTKKVSDDKIRSMTKEFTNKTKQLKEIKRSESDSYQEDTDIKNFWVPASSLP
jgi:hypothetical protein